MRRMARVLATLFVIAPTAAAQMTRVGLRADLVGCYTLDPGVGPPLYNAASRVRLDSTTVQATDAGANRRVLPLDFEGRPWSSPPRPGHLPPTWWADSLSDTVRVSFVDGFSGAVYVLAAPPRATTLRGRAYNRWDAGPSTTDERRVRAIRRPCSSASSTNGSASNPTIQLENRPR